MPVAATVSVSDHVEQQSRQQRGAERAATREVAWVSVETPLGRRG
jgi:predicted RNA-binding protein with PIN domain